MCKTECLLAVVALSIGLVNSWGKYPENQLMRYFLTRAILHRQLYNWLFSGMSDDFRTVYSGVFIQECRYLVGVNKVVNCLAVGAIAMGPRVT